MKKTLAAAITSALVIGAASTTFAAANPFSDVPTDHWSYDAVTKLAQEGVIEGYGDTQFKGDRTITRYEMAQMVAKAMTKANLNPQAKATLDKLAAEYGDELKNLGVRVAALEAKSDNVKWTGLARYETYQKKIDGVHKSTDDRNKMMLRLDMDAKVNDSWSVKSRMDTWGNGGENQELRNADKLNMHFIRNYIEGPLFGANSKFGKFEAYTAAGLTMDAEMTGAEFAFGKAVKTKIAAGRINLGDISGNGFAKATTNTTADYGTIQFAYSPSSKWDLNAGYEQIQNSQFEGKAVTDGAKKAGIYSVGGTYHFNPTFAMSGEYAENTKANVYEKAGSVQLQYKGAKANQPKSFGAFIAYRHLGYNSVFAPTYKAIGSDQKGYEIGVDYAFDKNIVAKIQYFDGKVISSDKDASKIFGRVEFMF